jgi:hypothetical protein
VFEPHTVTIRKGKIAKPNEFGNLVTISRSGTSDLAERQAELFVEADGERQRVRPELHRRRAERIRRLERMPPLHAPIAGVALTHVDVKAASPVASLKIAPKQAELMKAMFVYAPDTRVQRYPVQFDSL